MTKSYTSCALGSRRACSISSLTWKSAHLIDLVCVSILITHQRRAEDMVLALFSGHLHWSRLFLCRWDYQRNRAIYATRACVASGFWPIVSHLSATVQAIPNRGRGGEPPWVISRSLYILPPREVLPTSKRGTE